jgi:hypothetical protein
MLRRTTTSSMNVRVVCSLYVSHTNGQEEEEEEEEEERLERNIAFLPLVSLVPLLGNEHRSAR